jgi:hypothetical protein
MATRESIVEEQIERLNLEIGGLQTTIGGLETAQRSAEPDEKISLGAQISEKTALMTAKQNSLTAKQETLNLYLRNQQGNFSSHISFVPSQSSRCNPLPNHFRHLLFTHSGSATAQGKR